MRTPLAILLLAALAGPCSAAEDLITIPTRSGVTLSYLLDQDKAATPKVVVISFVGGLGASRGTISAAALGASLGDIVQGFVLSSTVTNADRMGTGLSAFDFGSIKVPVLLVHHRDDGCRSSPYSGAERLAKKFPLVSVSGGDPPQSERCEAVSQHGYLGREAPTAQAIRNWMLRREFAREIP